MSKHVHRKQFLCEWQSKNQQILEYFNYFLPAFSNELKFIGSKFLNVH